MAVSLRSESLKTKRTSLLPLSFVAAAVIPLLLVFDTATPEAVNALKVDPWNLHFKAGVEFMGNLVLPMDIILICTLLPQIEYRSNTWKQVFTSPQPLVNVFFSKFLTIHLLILVFFIAFNVFMAMSALVVNAKVPAFRFFEHSMDWEKLPCR
ncbi:ABC transporter permease [Pontibacter pamirensis]|uniref:ABC transporter permease n=1 Tax=Pontibacter pamirensis TaxID=2562824 RepID=UPI001F21258A|nr:ABC transporter permease [Pontibacter pamirensis]